MNLFLSLQILHENMDRLFGTGGFSRERTAWTMVTWLATRLFPWSLVLVCSLIRRLRGEREDPAGHFLHAWWITIFGVFALAAGKRAVYLLPLYPAIALLAARALAAVIPGSAEASHSDAAEKLPTSAISLSRVLLTPRRAGIAVAILDLTLIMANPTVWRHLKPNKARLAFIEKIESAVPRTSPLFAAPELSNSEVIVFAYRLERNIERKPVGCALRNDYFLVPIASINSMGAGAPVLAFSKNDDVALVLVEAPQRRGCASAIRILPTGTSLRLATASEMPLSLSTRAHG
jgi:hypothetical protein